jgi:hypothetical protein
MLNFIYLSLPSGSCSDAITTCGHCVPWPFRAIRQRNEHVAASAPVGIIFGVVNPSAASC